jgi:hypothetical protein
VSRRIDTEHPEATALENSAWDLKSAAEAFHSRAMTAETRTVLASAKRDVERVKARVLAELERRQNVRKRGRAPDTLDDGPFTPVAELPGLEGGGGHG